jgi:hypothetical protein
MPVLDEVVEGFAPAIGRRRGDSRGVVVSDMPGIMSPGRQAGTGWEHGEGHG